MTRRKMRAVDLVLDLRDDERGRRRAEAREGVVADVEQALGEVARARDREVPGEVEVAARDAGGRERRRRGLSMCGRRASLAVSPGGRVVAVGEEVGVRA